MAVLRRAAVGEGWRVRLLENGVVSYVLLLRVGLSGG